MSWTKTKNVFSLDPADTAGERNLNFTNMLASTWGVQVPASSKEDAVAHRIMVDRIREGVRQLGPSGFSIAGAFSFSGGFPANSFQSAMSKVTIDGLNVTEVGTALNSDTLSQYTLPAPPGSGTRNDLVYLEVFIVEVPGSTATTPTAVNKPDTSHVFKYGNVLFGGNNAVDDINEVNYEIRRRVQVQCRIRVVAGVDFVTYPNGLSDPGVFAQGPNVAATALLFASSVSDAGLWVAGNGSLAHQSTLGTLDGYVYAIPIAKVARTVGVTTLSSGDVTDLRKSWGPQTFLPRAGGVMNGPLVQAVGASVASAATLDLTAVQGNSCHVTGTIGVTAVILAKGKWCLVVFDGIVPLTHHVTNQNLTDGLSLTTIVGSRVLYWSDGTTVYGMPLGNADLGAAQTFTKAQRGAPVELPALVGTVTPDFALGNNWKGTLTGNITLANPSNLVAGQSGIIAITNGATPYTIAYGSYFKGLGGVLPALTGGPSAKDSLAYYVDNATQITITSLGDIR